MVNSKNELNKETSPYLLQHANNPVNWKAWNNETLSLAKKENKLMIISIGYSACHWCHVMEEESFENDSIAKVMNADFISIKVDREERPDIDNVYMSAVQLMTGSGGWPLNCITLPDGRPIFGGTYFTKDEWTKVLTDISKIYKESPEKAIEYADRLTKGIQNAELITVNKEKTNYTDKMLTGLITSLTEQLDHKKGGFKGTIKFPLPNSLDFLLRYGYHTDNDSINKFVQNTLTQLAYGGIYDQVGGGFSRYSVDEKWHVPHFEKMLYDNAQLVSVYAKAYQKDKKELYKKVVEETLDFVGSVLTLENGAFLSSLDADSNNEINELEEGAYYVWKEQELQKILGKDFPLFKDYFNINSKGLWEHDNYILIRDKSDIDFSNKHKLTLKEVNQKVTNWQSVLLKHRSKRNQPNIDDKTITSWNALMLKGYVDAYKAFNNEYYLQTALENANFILQNQVQKDGGLYRNYKNGKSNINAYAEDYATVIEAFISLYEVTLDEKWMFKAKDLLDYTFQHFFDEKTKMFFFTSDIDNDLISKKIEINDGVISSSNSILANNIFKLGNYFSDSYLLQLSKQMLDNVKISIEESPANYLNWMYLMTTITKPYYEVVVTGNNAKEIHKQMLKEYIPNVLIAGATTSNGKLPLLLNKFNDEKTLIFVCEDGACKLPQQNLNSALKTIEK